MCYCRFCGIIQSLTKLPMAQCTDEHSVMLPELVKNKNTIKYKSWLCPQLNSQYLLKGNFYSENVATIMITAKKFKNESDPNRPCYPQNQIDDLFNKYGNFYFSINYISTMINPGEVDYLSYYLEPLDYAIFSASSGSEHQEMVCQPFIKV